VNDDHAITVRRAGRDDLVRAARVLGDAFKDEPWTRWTVDGRDHQRRVEGLQFLALEHVGFPYGEVWVAEVAGTIESVAVWMHSDRAVPDAVWAATAGPQASLAGDRHEAALAAQDLVSMAHPLSRHLYLATIGTRGPWSGRGLGTAVLHQGLARADADGLPAFLETSTEDNVRFYEAFGFVVTDEIAIPGGPIVWTMLRPAATAGSPR